MMESLSLQAVTLTDGSTAYIQHTLKDAKLVEGQTIQLEDGTTAYIQQVTVHKGNDGDSLPFEDGQAVQLEDGTTAYIHHTPKDEFDPDAVQAVQLEDGTTAYIHHPVSLQGSNTILAVQTEAGLEALHATTDGTVDHETISALEHYANKVSVEDEGVSSTTGLPSDMSKNKPVQLVIDGEVRVSAKGQQIGEKAFRCGFEGCGRLYTTAHHLKVHERAHTGDRPYRCEQPGCGKAFATGYGLKSHTRTHTGEKPYKCPEDTCNKAFKTSGDLQKHIRTHTGERPFKCPFEGCGRSFTTSNIRKVHIRTHTGERPYICCEPGCGRGFASATNYKNHMRIHTGEKPYVCTVPGCGKRFTEYSSLYKHHVVHTHSKPYNCNHCGKTYRQTSTLATHKRTAHGDMEATEESEQALFEQQQHHQQATVIEPALKRPRVTYLSGVEGDGGIPTQVTMVTQDGLGSQVALISQDGTQQVSLSHEDLQALGTAITMVTQDGTTIAVPTHEGDLTGSTGAHTVTMVTADGTETQQVAIVTSDGMVTGDSALAALRAAEVVQRHQQVALVATANGTQIAVQLEEQQTLEEAIGMATAAIQHEGITHDTVMIDNGQ